MEVFECLHKQAYVFTQLGQCHLEFERTRGPSFFYYYFSLAKKLNHIAKVTSIFHFKLGDSCRPSYFLTSTPLEHISHLHDQLIANDRFLIWKNMIDLLQATNF
jgi:hypothetical protein